jgi:FKBP-type peptidyl-prolyl cis-trans isomerase.
MTDFAPLEANSYEMLPVPEKRSRTVRPSKSASLFKTLKSPSFAKSVVGLAEYSRGGLMDLPLRMPPMILMKAVIGDGALLKGLENGFPGMKKGEISYIVFSGKLGFGSDNVYNITKLSALIYHIRLTDIIKKEDKKNPQ